MDPRQHRLDQVAAKHAGVFRRADALAAGFAPGEVTGLRRRRTWTSLGHGTYAVTAGLPSRGSHARTVVDAWARLVTLAGDDVVSHVWAAALHRLPLLVALPPRVEVTRARPSLPSQDRALFVAALPAEDRSTVAGVPVTSLARTVVDIARREPTAAALVVADGALRTGLPAAALHAVVTRCGHWPGATAAARVVTLARPTAESPLESLVRLALHEHGLPEPEQQVDVRDATGAFIGRVDFLFRRQRVVVEADGRSKYAGLDADAYELLRWREKRREDRLREVGLVVVRVTWADVVHDAAGLAARVRAAMALAARHSA